MSDVSSLWVELIKVSPSLLMALVVIVLLIANADAIARLLKKASKVSALGIEIEASAASLDKAVVAGQIKVEGRREAANELLGMLDTFPFWFNIVTP